VIVKRLLQLRDARLGGRGCGFRTRNFFGQGSRALLGGGSLCDSQRQRLLDLDQPLALAAQALLDLAQRRGQRLQICLEASAVFVDDGVRRIGRGSPADRGRRNVPGVG